jgi:choline dehydrogenase-like flavoprotein
LDIQTVISAYKIFFERFKKLNKGNISYKEDEIRQNVMEEINNFSSRAHHLGTTRMSDSPENGVVDSNCKVYGISNLYIAGSSVFPTGGHANPTLTLIALTLRLADHLKKNNPPPLRPTSFKVAKTKKVLHVKALRFLSNFTLIFSARN